MRISFQPTDTGQTTEKWKISDREAKVQRIGTESGYKVDISGKVKDNEIYGGHGKTTKEVMQEAGMQDVAATRDYMTVMSNSMSDEEFAKLQEDGYHIGDMEIEDAVTIIDQIKASLLEAGVCINGYTDTLDTETLTEITGNEALARDMAKAFSEAGVPLTEETAQAAMQAFSEAQSLTAPSDAVYEYMLQNEKEPVIQDLYMAQYSALPDGERGSKGYYQDTNGYLSRKADTVDFGQLQTQIDKIIEEAGFTQKQEAREAAKWLIEAGIPLTEDTLSAYRKLSEISFPIEPKKLFLAMADAVSDGKSPGQADLTGAGSLWQQAYKIWKDIQDVSFSAADAAAQQGKPLTLQLLKRVQQQLDNGKLANGEINITARRQLEEVRLQMTIAANRELLKSGYAIETMQLEKLVESLKIVENKQNQILFGGQTAQETTENAQLYTNTLTVVSEIPEMPLAAVGRANTLDQIHTQGEALRTAYRKAGEQYETFWTKPDRTLGDSIQKAFQNAEVLLDELGLEASKENLRAIRILGYNHMDITEENVLTVKAADSALGNVLKKMTPAAVLTMIREEKNPLTMTLTQLDDYLSGQQQEEEAQQEKFSKFLYKLEQKKEISKEEKESYIGIFRLMRQIEKTDGAVIGSLVNQGAELSFRNLLTAVRTYRAKPIDKTADDEHGAVKELVQKGSRIDEQIESYYKTLAHKLYHEMDGDKIVEIAPDMDTNLEEFAERLTETEVSEKMEFAYRRWQMESMRAENNVSETEIEFLQMLEEPITWKNIKGAEKFRQNISKAFMKIKEKSEHFRDDEKAVFEKAAERLEEEFAEKEKAGNAYREFVDTEKEILEHAMYEEDGISSLDIKELGLLYKQISFTAKLSEREHYEIPIITDDSVTALHLQLVHSAEESEKGTIELSIDLERYGELSVRLQLRKEGISGIYAEASKAGSKEAVSNLKEQIENSVQALFNRTREGEEGVSTGELYKAAKAMIGIIRREAERN